MCKAEALAAHPLPIVMLCRVGLRVGGMLYNA